MNICVIGTGYVGLVAGACLSEMGHQVVCVDKILSKVEMLRACKMPIYEVGLEDVVKEGMAQGMLSFTDDGPGSVAGCEVVFIAVGTPSASDGSANLDGVMAVASMIGKAAAGPLTVVIKSTVPVGTADRVAAILRESSSFAHDVVNNPEFLKEGAALEDFRNPDRIIVGCAGEGPRRIMERLYKPLLRLGKPILFMDNRSAEMSKYAANAFLATRISFINELALLCERVGADIEAVRRGAGSDNRIGTQFFHPGVGYGGSCFPKDVRALQNTAHGCDFNLRILAAVEDVNQGQKAVLGQKVLRRFGGDLSGLKVALWGLAFKPGTDDMREAPSLVIIDMLLEANATISAFDPEAMDEARGLLGDRIDYAAAPLSALDGADMLLVVTEWDAFRNPDLDELRQRMRQLIVFDGRNIYEPTEFAEAGVELHCIGRGEERL